MTTFIYEIGLTWTEVPTKTTKKLIDEIIAIDPRAKFKFQYFKPEDLYDPTDANFDSVAKLDIDADKLRELIVHTGDRAGCTFFQPGRMEELYAPINKNFIPAFFKIASPHIVDHDLISEALEYQHKAAELGSNRPVLISCGGTDSVELQKTVKFVTEYARRSSTPGLEICFLACQPKYPYEFLDIKHILTVKEAVDTSKGLLSKLGWSHHNPSTKDILSMCHLGAEYVELHVSPNGSMIDRNVAVSIDKIQSMLNEYFDSTNRLNVRNIGDNSHHRMWLTAYMDISKGNAITEHNSWFRRNSSETAGVRVGMAVSSVENDTVNKPRYMTAIRHIKKGELITTANCFVDVRKSSEKGTMWS